MFWVTLQNDVDVAGEINAVQRSVLALIGTLSLAGGVAHADPVSAEGVITVANRSAAKIKVVGEGGSTVVDVGVEGVEVRFDGGKDVGIDVKIWWVSKPRELCQLFVPWERAIVVSGKSTILCRSR